MNISIGLIGFGTIAPFYLHAFAKIKSARLTAICSPSLNKRVMIEKNDFRYFSNYLDLIKDSSIDAVIVATPNYLHSKITIDALKRGKHVLCEKPMATSLRDAKRMVLEARRANRTLYVGFHNRFNSEVLRVKKNINPEKVQRILGVYNENILDHSNQQDLWYLNPNYCGGGCVIDNGSNILDVMYELVGPFRVTKSLLDFKNRAVEITAKIKFTFQENKLGNIILQWDAKQEEKKVHLFLGNGAYEEINFLKNETKGVGSHMLNEYKRLLTAFIGEVEKNEQRGERGLAIQEVINTIYQIKSSKI